MATNDGRGEILTRNNVRVEWAELGEGLSGDYDPEDPEDIELLRFDVSIFWNGKWDEADDASYCTRVPVSATDDERAKGLAVIMDEVYEWASQGHPIKRICERLSWIDLDWIRKASISKEIHG